MRKKRALMAARQTRSTAVKNVKGGLNKLKFQVTAAAEDVRSAQNDQDLYLDSVNLVILIAVTKIFAESHIFHLLSSFR